VRGPGVRSAGEQRGEGGSAVRIGDQEARQREERLAASHRTPLQGEGSDVAGACRGGLELRVVDAEGPREEVHRSPEPRGDRLSRAAELHRHEPRVVLGRQALLLGRELRVPVGMRLHLGEPRGLHLRELLPGQGIGRVRDRRRVDEERHGKPRLAQPRNISLATERWPSSAVRTTARGGGGEPLPRNQSTRARSGMT